MPFAFVDLDLFDANVAAIAQRVSRGKTIRVASKSLRCVSLLERVLAADPVYRGVLSYCVREAVFLSRAGFDDILIAYPAMREIEDSGLLDELCRGKRIVLVVDCIDHIDLIEALGREYDVSVPVCLDLDLSTDFPGIRFGVRRSPVDDEEKALVVAHRIREARYVTLEGLMGYEAQIAGVPDKAPGRFCRNAVIRFLKSRSIPKLRERRRRVVRALRDEGFDLAFVNGGGTGSVESTCEDDYVTEVAVGSGFFSPTQFDWYTDFYHQPAVGYAIEITRLPAPAIYTCHGGGYVASGACGVDKLPRPYLPDGAHLIKFEGAGEVQTPIVYGGPEPLGLGDPVFMRYSKAGEMCERFNCLYAVHDGRIVDELPTYRGEGQQFV
jgi:D-serine deaminase-like pyridoxal phosphate-dependent protein